MAPKNKISVFIDTNWWISASINAKSRKKIYTLLKQDKIEILYTNKLLKKYFNVISIKGFRHIISLDQAEKFIRFVIPRLTQLKDADLQKPNIEIRDPKDIYIFAAIMENHVDYLITGDEDLLSLKEIGKTKIVTMSWFFDSLISK
ncbi:MAG: putative toxin-antitoxin system toxin component, PIN family [Bacteroidales bacterium]